MKGTAKIHSLMSGKFWALVRWPKVAKPGRGCILFCPNRKTRAETKADGDAMLAVLRQEYPTRVLLDLVERDEHGD